jgi:hypothetical protein
VLKLPVETIVLVRDPSWLPMVVPVSPRADPTLASPALTIALLGAGIADVGRRRRPMAATGTTRTSS